MLVSDCGASARPHITVVKGVRPPRWNGLRTGRAWLHAGPGQRWSAHVQSLVLALAVPCVIVLAASTAHASPLFELVGDPGATGSLQARVLCADSAAAYFNPALLTEAPEGVTLGVMVLNQRIGVTVDGRPGTEFAIPEGLENARNSEGERFALYPAATNLLQFGRTETASKPALDARPRQGAGSGHSTRTYVVAGIVAKLLKDRVALGLHALLPAGEFTRMRAFFNDEREQYFSNSLHPEMYADRMLALSLASGVGVKITDELSLGLGTTFALETSVNAGAYVIDASNLSNILLSMDAPVHMGVAPHFGVSYLLANRLRLSATAHTPQRIELGTGFTFLLPNLIEDASSLKFVLDYMPWRAGFGAAFDIVKSPSTSVSVVANVLWANWSTYKDRHGEVPSGTYAWRDTFSPTLGARYQKDRLTTALDLTYVPTPVPLQTGRSNYVDNDRLGGSLGAEYKFDALGTTLSVGAQAQIHHLLTRFQRKLPTETSPDGTIVDPERVRDEVPDDAVLNGSPVIGAEGLQTNNPGWPGFSSGGWILAGTVHVSIAM